MKERALCSSNIFPSCQEVVLEVRPARHSVVAPVACSPNLSACAAGQNEKFSFVFGQSTRNSGEKPNNPIESNLGSSAGLPKKLFGFPLCCPPSANGPSTYSVAARLVNAETSFSE